ncbi:MAG: hypothetical protein E3J70_05385 [Candidatus Heimdallarchaeota archaeon]|nr:MAG: hypothetical protein E3J70_05385 [Candidatus Heimdallarchaeota archaeon]
MTMSTALLKVKPTQFIPPVGGKDIGLEFPKGVYKLASKKDVRLIGEMREYCDEKVCKSKSFLKGTDYEGMELRISNPSDYKLSHR